MVDQAVLLFDGACNLCNAMTRFVIDRDPPPGRFRFVSLQSDMGRRLLQDHGLPVNEMETVVLIERGCAYTRSTAALRMLKRLGLPWSMFYLFIVIPRPLRDAGYRWIARNRYRWFGRSETCTMPDESDRARFLE